MESKEKCKCLKYHHNKCSKFLENEENTVVKQDSKEERHWCSKDCEYCESGVNHDPISMFCHLRDEHKQDTTDWATEFDEKYSIFPIGYYSEELVPNSGEKEPIKDFIQSVRQKAQQEVVEILKKKLNELPRYGSSQHTIPANFWCYSQDDIDELAESLLSNQ